MPGLGLPIEMDRTSWIQLCLLMMVIPAQIILTDLLGNPEFERSDSIRRIVTSAQFYYEKYCVNLSDIRRQMRVWVYSQALSIDDYDEPPPKDSPKTSSEKDSSGLLGASLEVHSPRGHEVTFKVGQVVKHKRFGYRAVIIGWDERPKAPEGWFRDVVPRSELAAYTDQPFYAVLIDTRDRAPQTTYIPQANIEILHHTKVIHPSLSDYFEDFDWVTYNFQMRPWLKRIYPHDGP